MPSPQKPAPKQHAPPTVYRLEIGVQPQHSDPLGDALLARTKHFLGHLPLTAVRTAQILFIPADALNRQNLPKSSPFLNHHHPDKAFESDGQPRSKVLRALAKTLFADDVLNVCGINGELLTQTNLLGFKWDRWVEVIPKPGVTDAEGHSAQSCLEWYLNTRFCPKNTVRSGRAWLLQGICDLAQAQQVSQSVSNHLIHRVQFFTPKTAVTTIKRERPDGKFSAPETSPTTFELKPPRLFPPPNPPPSSSDTVEFFLLQDQSTLLQISQQRLLALNEAEAQAIVDHFSQSSVQAKRKEAGLTPEVSDVELEMLAQTWSEHCKHKIFQARIHYHDEHGQQQHIDSLFNTYIRTTTQTVREKLGQDDFCLSVFSDNAGVVRFNAQWSLAFKVETHNSPSALDPYGGALTGILGVNRDAFGTGRGAELLFNTNVFCFASPFYHQALPNGLLHPRRIYEGVRLGVEHGGNKCGVPTVNGSLSFDPRFLGKPLVFCGTASLLPSQLHGRPGHEKWVEVGSRIVMVGGRVGRDGIHGATFSSLELDDAAPRGVVQIGDPIVQKMLFDFLLCARDQGLYTAITDNGAGGLSSSVGEMAQLSGHSRESDHETSPFDAPPATTHPGGADLHLECAPLKHPNLTPWEILVSESQERMTLAVPPQHLPALLSLAQKMDVEATDMGQFTNRGELRLFWKGNLLGLLDLDFLHHGLPQMELHAQAPSPPQTPLTELPQGDLTPWLLRILGRLNVCSKERVVRQYDHEVQAGTVIKPLCGVLNDGPSDAAVLRPVADSLQGVAVAHGLCPRYGDLSAYHMAACALDEAVRSLVCVGADPRRIAALDNFCWCDPLPAANNPHAKQRLGQLVQCAQGLHDCAVHYGIPLISGKDSMKNDYVQDEVRISIPPTLLVSALGVLEDVRQAISMDAKAPEDLVWLVGETKDALGASEFAMEWTAEKGTTDDTQKGYGSGFVAQANPAAHKAVYTAVHQAMQAGLICSAHDCSDGGMAVALAECAFAGGMGMFLNVHALTRQSQLSPAVLLFAESPGRLVLTTRPQHKKRMEQIFQTLPLYMLGRVTRAPRFVMQSSPTKAPKNGSAHSPAHRWIDAPIQHLKNAWQKPLREV